MATISVRVDDGLKREMEKYPHVNWSEILRQAIVRTIRNELERNLAKAVLINERIAKEAPPGYNSTAVIREFREARRAGPRNERS
ncbi:MAG: hypothetical protein Kow0069_10110 [Promethearchaeota archaeon]